MKLPSTQQSTRPGVELHQLVWQQDQELEEYPALIRTKRSMLNKNDGRWQRSSSVGSLDS